MEFTHFISAAQIGNETEPRACWQSVTEGKISQLEASLGSGEAVEAMHRFNWLLRESEEGTLGEYTSVMKSLASSLLSLFLHAVVKR